MAAARPGLSSPATSQPSLDATMVLHGLMLQQPGLPQHLGIRDVNDASALAFDCDQGQRRRPVYLVVAEYDVRDGRLAASRTVHPDSSYALAARDRHRTSPLHGRAIHSSYR